MVRAFLRWFVLTVVVLGASCAASVGQEQRRAAVTASAEPALAEETADDLSPVLPAEPGVPFRAGVAASRAPLTASSRWLAAPQWLDETPSQSTSATLGVGCGSCATLLDGEQAVVQPPQVAPKVATRAVSPYVLGRGPVLAPGIEDEDAILAPRYDLAETAKVPQGGDRSYGTPVALRSDRRLLTEAWSGGRHPLLVEDTDRYWLVDPTAGQLARPNGVLAGPDVATPSGTGAVPAQPVTAPGEVASLPPSERRLLVDQAAQVMHVYEGGIEVRALPVSTGLLTSKTFTRAWEGLVGQDLGAATVDGGMRVDQAWYLFPDLFGNILLHTVPYVQQGTLRVYDQPEALGVRPSSHGCVRMSVQDAQWLKEWGPVGVPIEITAPPGPIRQVR